MIFPRKLKKEDLQHPKNARGWQGDLRRKDELQGFVKAGRVHSVEGTRPPSNLKPVELPRVGSKNKANSRDFAGCKPIPADHRFQVSMQPKPTDNQMQMLSPKQRKQHKSTHSKPGKHNHRHSYFSCRQCAKLQYIYISCI